MTPHGILMVVSPGENELAADSLRRALRHAPGSCDVFLVNNSGLADPTTWWPGVGDGHRLRVLSLTPSGPRPYFEIARTIFSALQQIAPTPPDLLFKIDPDTLVLDPGFFRDIAKLDAAHGADFYACHAPSHGPDQRRRKFRLLADLVPAGVGRRQGRNRYGRSLAPRLGRVWCWRVLKAARSHHGSLAPSTQPSGGFYALRGSMLRTLADRGLLATDGANGLEWNDDTLLPLAVRAANGAICDVRQSTFASHWGWMHGSRYFTDEQALVPGLRALHPVKWDEAGRRLRARLDRVDSASR